MPVDTGYLERLKTWVESAIEAADSQNKLAAQLGVKPPTLIKWRNGNLRNGLDDSSIQAIARHRAESAEVTRAWLEGKELLIEDPLLNAVRTASLSSLISGMKAIAHRLEVLTEDKFMNQTVVSFIQAEFARKGKSPDTLADFMEFFECAPFEAEERERIQKIATGQIAPERDDIPDLAVALEEYSGTPVPEALLYGIWRNSYLSNSI